MTRQPLSTQTKKACRNTLIFIGVTMAIGFVLGWIANAVF